MLGTIDHTQLQLISTATHPVDCCNPSNGNFLMQKKMEGKGELIRHAWTISEDLLQQLLAHARLRLSTRETLFQEQTSALQAYSDENTARLKASDYALAKVADKKRSMQEGHCCILGEVYER